MATPADRRSSRPAVVAALFAGYLLLAVVATWPLAPNLTDHVLGEPRPPGEGTARLNIWAMGFVLHQLPRQPWRLFEGNAFYPYAHTLALSEHLFVPSLMAAPFVLLTGNLVFAYNAVLLITLATAGLGTYLLARELGARGLGAFAAGVLYAFHTWNVNETQRIQILSNQWFPFVLLALLRYFAAPSRRRAALVGLACALQALSCMYWALYLPLLVGGVALFLQWRHRLAWRSLLPLGVALAVMAVLVVPFLVPYSVTSRELGLERPPPPAVGLDRYFDVLPENVLYAKFLGTARRGQNAAHFLGFVAMGLAAIGLLRPPREAPRPLLAVMAAAGLLLSLGPEIRWGETVFGPGPYALVRKIVPGFRNVRYPERFSLFLVLGLAPLAAFGLDRLTARVGRVAAAAAIALLFVEHLSVPRQIGPIPPANRVPSVYHWLAGRPDVRVVADVPSATYPMERADSVPMYFSTVHWKRTVLAFTGYFPPIQSFVRWRLFHFPSPESVAFLVRFGVDTVVVSPSGGAVPAWARPDPRWDLVGPFAEGHVVLRLKGAAGQAYGPPDEDGAGLVEAGRRHWAVEASAPGGHLALDGDPATAWRDSLRQEEGDFIRVRFPRPIPVARVSLLAKTPFQESAHFPTRLRLLGKTPGGPWEPIPFDERSSYDRLFASLLHRPREAWLHLDVTPRPLAGIVLEITETDPFELTWTLPELRVYRRP